MSTVEESKKEKSRRKGDMCDKATKSTAEEVEESRGEEDSIHGQTMRSIADRIEKKPSIRLMTKGTRILWRRHPG